MLLKMILYVIIAGCWGRTLSIPQHMFNKLKPSMLALFGLKEEPKLEGKTIQIPEALRKLYEANNNLEYETVSLPIPGLFTKSANVVRSFMHVESPTDEKFTKPNKFRLKFDLSTIPKTEKLKAAEIQISRKSQSSPSSKQRLLVYDIIRPGSKGDPPITRLLDSQLVDTRQNTTLSIDVSLAAQRWLLDPKSNFGIIVSLHSKQNHLRLKRSTEEDWSQHQPFLFAYTDDGKNKQTEDLTKLRMKRGAKRRNRKNQERDPCRRRPMVVNFKEVAWSDWIVAPSEYNAYFCAGDCDYPIPDHLNTSNHAILQSVANSVKPMEVPKPCCVPTSLSQISMLYVADDKSVILKNYKDMVVEGCGCR